MDLLTSLTPPVGYLESVGSEPATDPTISLRSLRFFTMCLSIYGSRVQKEEKFDWFKDGLNPVVRLM